MHTAKLGATALALCIACSTASARDIASGGFTLGDTVQWLRSKGYQTEIVADPNATVMAKQHVRIVLNGVKIGFYLFDCSGERCGSLQFSAGWSMHGKFDT